MLSEAQFKALRAIAQSGGGAILDKYNRVIAAGEILPYHPATVLRLCMAGLMEACDGHAYVTPAGRRALKEKNDE